MKRGQVDREDGGSSTGQAPTTLQPSPDPSHQTRLSPRAGKVLPATLLLGNVEIYKQFCPLSMS